MSLTPQAFASILINAAVVGECVIIMALLVGRGWPMQGRVPLHLTALFAFFATAAVDTAYTIAAEAGAQIAAPWLLRTQYLAWPIYPVSLWLYVRSLTEAEPRLARKHLAHLAPMAVVAACLAPFYLLSNEDKTRLVFEDATPAGFHQVAAMVGSSAFIVFWLALLAAYAFATLRRLRHHRQEVKELFSTTEGAGLGWISGIFALIGGMAGVAIVEMAVFGATGLTLLPYGWNAGYWAVVVCVFGYFGVRQDPSMPHWAAAALASKDESVPMAAVVVAPAEPSGPAYARSALTAEDSDRIVAKLDRAMAAGALWRAPLLNLRDLAEAAGVKASYVSQALNTRLGKNFYDYVNGWRVREACSLLFQGEESVLTIAVKVGFNSKSTFNAAFKRYAGMTPTQYRAAQSKAPEVSAVEGESPSAAGSGPVAGG